MSNYPPGVSGFEPQIAGASERDGEDMSLECDSCEFAGEVPSTLYVWDRYSITQVWECPECGREYERERDAEDFRETDY